MTNEFAHTHAHDAEPCDALSPYNIHWSAADSPSDTNATNHDSTTDTTLSSTLRPLLSDTDNSLIVATDDGSTVFAHAAHTVHPLPALADAIIALARTTADPSDAQSALELLDAALWEFGMEHTSLMPTADAADHALLRSTAADVMLLVQQVLAIHTLHTPTTTATGSATAANQSPHAGAHAHAETRCPLALVPGISLLAADHGSLVCIVHLATPPLQPGDPRHATVRAAVHAWLRTGST